jgi:hypothetical protein
MADFSCYITIINKTFQTLTRNNYGQTFGTWKSNPPESIAPKTSSAQFQLADKAGPAGSTGWVDFAAAPGALFSMDFDDPYDNLQKNKCSISSSGAAGSRYRTSFRAKSGSGDWQPGGPPGGHPLYVEFTISKDLPRAPTAKELSDLTLAYPKLDKNSVFVLGERTLTYNSFAWSLGMNHTWINPPLDLTDVQKMYATAADSVHTPVGAVAWRANSNWSAVAKGDPAAIIDGWSVKVMTQAPGPAVTHASRRTQSADFPNPVWTSKIGENLLITHNRDAFSGGIGELVTSFVQVPPVPPGLSAELERRHAEMMAPQFFTEANRDDLVEAVDAIPESVKEEFAELHDSWLAAVAEKLSFSSDTRDGARLPEFDALVALGAGILPLVIDRIYCSPTTYFRLAVLYDGLQQQPELKVMYSPEDPCQFEGEPARAARSAKLWLDALASGRIDGAQ